MDLARIAGRKRVIIEYVGPQIDAGQYPIKRIPGEKVEVVAHIFIDGHDCITAELVYKNSRELQWHTAPLTHRVNDEWVGEFEVEEIGCYVYSVRAWVDHFRTWQNDLRKKFAAGQNIRVDLQIGAEFLRDLAQRANPTYAKRIRQTLDLMAAAKTDDAVEAALDEKLTEISKCFPPVSLSVRYSKELGVLVDHPRAVYSTWYELFPRSCGQGLKHGTFADCEKLLDEIAELGFDIVYLPPIHPIGITNRKGRNNSPSAAEGEPGSPWAIGGDKGGHIAIHPELGTLADFKRFLKKARARGIEIALDMAFQCSPDHPWVREHPEWFRFRPDGTVQYAENPPKKYEDILPLNFESADWPALWEALRNVVLYWVEQGVRVFRVDNPHTKPFAFWEWMIAQVRRECPEVIFLSEAFTRPKVMQRLAKAGFDQSYTYFTWRNTKYEIEHYIEELTKTDVGEYMRPNFWPNTPDILPEYLQAGGRAGFIIRLVLAATLSSCYGIYGPAYELCVADALEGKEEYLDSEKFEIKDWDRNAPGNIKSLIKRVNRIRRDNPALHYYRNIRFFPTDNEMMVCYGKIDPDDTNMVVTVVNLDPHFKQSCRIHIPIEEYGIDPKQLYLMHDHLSGDRYIWNGENNYIELDPRVLGAHIMTVKRKMKKEADFDYFM